MEAYTSQFLEEMKGRLQEEKQRLESELGGLRPHTELGGGSLEDEAMEIPVDEVNQDIIARIKKDLEKIGTALTSIESGKYGFDINTGEPIGEERLRAIPWAETAI